MDTFRIKRKPNFIGDVVDPTSVDFGGKLYLVHQCVNGFNIVIRKPAYTVWEGRAQYGTDPARMMVGALFMDGEQNVWIKLFWEKETGRKWRSVMSEAIRVASTEKADLPKWGNRMPRYNDTTNQARITAAAATIVNRVAYDNLPDAAKAATLRAWQAQLRAETGCTEKTARKHIRRLCG